jgi:hypothetical protein
MQVVGPGISLEDYKTGKPAVDLFEGRIREWILGFAKELAGKEHSGIAVLILASSVIQPLGGVLPFTRREKRNNAANFCNGFVRIFPEVPGCKDTWKFAKRVCDRLRNGLFHEAFIKPGLLLSNRAVPIAEESGQVVIDPVRFLEAVETVFVDVCEQIRAASAESEIRASFETYWNGKETINAKREAATPFSAGVPVYTTNTFAPASATTLAPSIRIPFKEI